MNRSTSLLVACGNINRLYKQIADNERSRTAEITESKEGQRIGKEILYVPLLKQSKK